MSERVKWVLAGEGTGTWGSGAQVRDMRGSRKLSAFWALQVKSSIATHARAIDAQYAHQPQHYM